MLDQLYVRLCRSAGRIEGLRHTVPEELERNLEFGGLDVEGEEVAALALLGVALSGTAALAAALAHLFLGLPLPIVMGLAPLPVLVYLLVGWYPRWKAEREQVRGQGEVPRLVSYLAMSLRTNPNLERSVQFAAERASGPLGSDLRRELWRSCLRVHDSVEEALSEFSRRWSDRCKELDRSIDLLRASVSERDLKSRMNAIDRALELSLEGTRDRMRDFASGLYLPTLVIYSIGVLLPLVILAVLPALSIIDLRIGAPELVLGYCIILPLTVYGLGKYVLAKRPAAFQPPDIPARGGPARNVGIAAVLAIVTAALGFWLGLGPIARSLLVLWGLTLGIVAYLHLSSSEAYRLRLEEDRMEEEFQDALVQLGNHMSEGRPAEDAFRRAAESTRGSSIARVFERTSTNIRLGGMRLRSALFDPDEGALREVRSPTIRGTLQLLVDSLERGNRVAGQVVLSTAEHLRGLRRVELEIRRSLSEVVSSMRSVALLFAPLVAAVTARLQEVLATESSGVPFLGGGAPIPFATFLSVMGFYIIALTCILVGYSVELEHGDDGVLKRAALARALPVAMSVFTLGVVAGGQMMSSILG